MIIPPFYPLGPHAVAKHMIIKQTRRSAISQWLGVQMVQICPLERKFPADEKKV